MSTAPQPTTLTLPLNEPNLADQPLNALILGARGGVGEALAHALSLHPRLQHPQSRFLCTSRDPQWVRQAPQSPSPQLTRAQLDLCDEAQWAALVEQIQAWPTPSLDLIINATGLLHDQARGLNPERALKQLELESMRTLFEVNTFGVALALKHLTPLMPRKAPSIFASLSARVGSISDNRLGGWHSYRASKAAQHMLIKGASIELARTHPLALCVALHPGTVSTALSAPFTSAKTPRLLTPEQSAEALLRVLAHLTPQSSGRCFAWDGLEVPS